MTYSDEQKEQAQAEANNTDQLQSTASGGSRLNPAEVASAVDVLKKGPRYYRHHSPDLIPAIPASCDVSRIPSYRVGSTSYYRAMSNPNPGALAPIAQSPYMHTSNIPRQQPSGLINMNWLNKQKETSAARITQQVRNHTSEQQEAKYDTSTIVNPLKSNMRQKYSSGLSAPSVVGTSDRRQSCNRRTLCSPHHIENCVHEPRTNFLFATCSIITV